MLWLIGETGEAKGKPSGPFSPRSPGSRGAPPGDGRLCVQVKAMFVAFASRSAVQLPVLADDPGGTACAASRVKFTMSTVRGRIWPRIAPAGRPAVWMLT